jgi:hypothetical protein
MRDGYIGRAARGGSAQLTLVRGKRWTSHQNNVSIETTIQLNLNLWGVKENKIKPDVGLFSLDKRGGGRQRSLHWKVPLKGTEGSCLNWIRYTHPRVSS